MFKYIGIRGHRGAGKQTIAYLIGVAVDFYRNNHSWEGFDEVYKEACDNICMNSEYWRDVDLSRVVFESFGDGVKYVISSLFNIPKDYMDDDFLKDNAYVNLKDFRLEVNRDKWAAAAFHQDHKGSIIDEKELFRLMYKKAGVFFELHTPNVIDTDMWISLRGLITYFGKYVMQGLLGKNVWIKSFAVNEEDMGKFYADNKTVYKILVDCKTCCEISYIINAGGKVINVIREDNIKDESEISKELSSDNRCDFTIHNDGRLEDLQKEIEDITLKILG